MTPVSQAISADGRRTPPSARTGPDRYSGAFKVAVADVLLRTTGQYGKWEALRRNDDGLAVKIADLVLERHDLLDKARRGEAVSREAFDALTGKLRESGIRLYGSAEPTFPYSSTIF